MSSSLVPSLIIRIRSPLPMPAFLSSSLSSDLRCTECKSDDILEDQREGVIVCKQCGLVLSSQLISEEPEWRIHQDDDENGHSLNQTIVSRTGTEDETLPTFRGLSTIPPHRIKRKRSDFVSEPIPLALQSPPPQEEDQEDTETRAVQSMIDKCTVVIQDGGKKLGSSPTQIAKAIDKLAEYMSDQLEHNSKIRIKYREVSIAFLWISMLPHSRSIQPFVQYLDPTLNPRTTENLQLWRNLIKKWVFDGNKKHD